MGIIQAVRHYTSPNRCVHLHNNHLYYFLRQTLGSLMAITLDVKPNPVYALTYTNETYEGHAAYFEDLTPLQNPYSFAPNEMTTGKFEQYHSWLLGWAIAHASHLANLAYAESELRKRNN